MNLGAVVQLARNRAVLTILDQGVVSAANFATSIIIGRFAAKSDLGLYALGFTLVVIAQNMQSALITSAYQVFSPRMAPDDRRSYTGSTLVHHALWALTAMGLLCACGSVMRLGSADAAELAPVVLTLGAVIWFILLKEYARQLSFARLHTGVALALDVFVATAQVSGLAVLAALGWLSGDRAYWAIGLGAGLGGAAWLLFRRDEYEIRQGRVAADFWEHWPFSRWVLATGLAFMAANQVYPWLLVSFHGPVANGEFSACNSVVFLVNPFILGLGNFIGPRAVHALAENGIAGMQRVVRIATVFFGVTIGLFALAMLVFGDFALVLLFGDKYAGNGGVVALLAFATLAWAVTVPVNHGLNALNRPDVSFKALLCALAVTATVGVWLVWAYGPTGVALGLIIGNVAALVYTRIAYWRALRHQEREEKTEG